MTMDITGGVPIRPSEMAFYHLIQAYFWDHPCVFEQDLFTEVVIPNQY